MSVPGPVDREDFADAQVRHRRASRWFTALGGLTIGLLGVPLSAVLSPLLYAAAFVAVDVVGVILRKPDLLAPLARGDSSSASTDSAVTVAQVVVAAALLLLPGSLLLLFAWLGVRALLRHAGSGGTVLALGAREPRTGDLEEQQFRNVVEEVAVASGVPPPAVRVIDSPVPNVAAVGSGIDDATVVVTTGLLGTLDRDETQGVVAMLVGSVGNGDLHIGTTVASVFQTLGLVGSVLRAPSEGRPRTTLRALLRYAFRRTPDSRAALADLLTREGVDPDPDYTDTKPNGVKSVLLAPFIMAGGAFMMTQFIFGFVLVGPVLHRAWRARRYLADATAVQLTRNPDGLARALVTLSQRGDVVPGTEWAAHLFAVGPPGSGGGGAPLVAFHAPVAKRIDRLRAMGADVAAPARPPYTRGGLVLLLVLLGPLYLAAGLLMLACAVLLTMVSLMIDVLLLAPMVAVLHAVLHRLAGG